MDKLEKVTDLVFKRNEFMNKSVLALKPILDRPKPFNLQTLRIVNCRISK